MFWRLKKRRLVGLGILCLGCLYIFQAEVEKSWNRRKKTAAIDDSLTAKPVALNFDHEQYIAQEKRLGDAAEDFFEKHAFNLRISDAIPVDRNIPDTRHKICKEKVFDIPLDYSVSVLISFHNEARSALLRTIVSVLNRTPDAWLKEIILVDDFSDDEKDGSELADFPKVRVFRNKQRQDDNDGIEVLDMTKLPQPTLRQGTARTSGLAKSRMFAVQRATGSHVMFLDSHCEVNTGWLTPLFHTLKQHPKALASPVIDIIDTETFDYKSSSGELKGGFDWNLNYRWLPDSKHSKEALGPPDFYKTPVIPGGLFLVNKTWFEELGGLDVGMDIWGAENIEVSIKAWLCGGEVLSVPCSRVGHVFRRRHPYSFPPNGSLSTYLKNAKRIAENWLDDYKYQFYDVKPEAKIQELGKVDEVVSVKQRLKCHPFQWYLDNVYPELKPLSKDALALGRLQQENLCLQTVTSQQNKTSVILTDCSETKKEQEWFFSKTGELHQDDFCLTASIGSKKPKVYLAKCSTNSKQKWTRRRRLLMFQGLCLENALDLAKGHSYLTLNPCRQKAFSQMWDFSVELQTWGDR